MKTQKETVVLDISTRLPNEIRVTAVMNDEIEIIHRIIKGLGWKKAKGGFYYKQFLVGIPD